MKFKELFGSFTDHRVENRSTGMRYGSTGSVGAKNRKFANKSPSPTAWDPSATPSGNTRRHQKSVSSHLARRQQVSFWGPVADGVRPVGDG
ncbi:hypothetical protein Hanom_Chr14g01289771 [Helianthus anomalus]